MHSRRSIVFFVFFLCGVTPPFSLLPRLSHPLSLHIHLSFAHLSLLPQLYACSHFISTLFSFLLFAFSKILSGCFSLSLFSPLCLPLACLFIFHAFAFCSFICQCVSPLQRIYHTFFLGFLPLCYYRCLSRRQSLQ